MIAPMITVLSRFWINSSFDGTFYPIFIRVCTGMKSISGDNNIRWVTNQVHKSVVVHPMDRSQYRVEEPIGKWQWRKSMLEIAILHLLANMVSSCAPQNNAQLQHKDAASLVVCSKHPSL